MQFLYKKTPEGIYFPLVPIFIYFQNKNLKIRALIDSGATISIFRSEVAEQLGITIEKGEEIFLGGIGGRIRGFRHLLQLEIAGKKFPAPVVFSDEYLVKFNLLGRENIFKNFKILFNEKDLLIEFL